MKEVDIISKVVGRQGGGAVNVPSVGSSPSVDLSGYLLKKVWDEAFELKEDANGVPYLFGKLNLVVAGGITMYAEGDGVDIPSIYAGLPIDGTTIYWDGGFLKAQGGGSGGGITDITSSMVVSALGYTPANASDLTTLQSTVNDFLSGSDTDSIINKWKELEAFLSGLSESDNLATILGTKANKATTLAGYGIADAYTKSDVNTLLGDYVTLATAQTITGKKDFTTGGLFVNGKQIQYIPIDSDSGYWKLEGDLLVTGGITMFANEGTYTPSTIMDALILDDATLGINADGELYVKGGTGGGVADSVAWDDVTGKPTFATVATSGKYSDLIGVPTLLSSFTDDVVAGKYLPLSGGILISTDRDMLTIMQTGVNALGPYISFITGKYTAVIGLNTEVGAVIDIRGDISSSLHVRNDGTLRFRVATQTNDTAYIVWHSGNDGSNSGLDADLLDGSHKSDLLTNISSTSTTNLSITVGGTTKNINDIFACKAEQLETSRTIWGQSFNGTNNVSGALSGATTGSFTSNVNIGGTLAVTGVTTLGNELSISNSSIRNLLILRALDTDGAYATFSNNTTSVNIGLGGDGALVDYIGVSGTGNINLLDTRMVVRLNRVPVLDVNNCSIGLSPVGDAPYKSVRLLMDKNSDAAYLQAGNYEGTKLAGKLNITGINGGELAQTVIKSIETIIAHGENVDSWLKFRGSGANSTKITYGISGSYQGDYLSVYNYVAGQLAARITGINLLVYGGITMYSDIRKKTKLQDVELSLSQIANAPLIEHYYNSDDKRTTHVGSIAQYWAGLNDWFCKLDNEGYYTMEIQNAALASAISVARHLQKYESKTDRTIRKLKKRISELEDEVEKLKSA